MKTLRKILPASLILACLPFGLGSCVTDAYVGTGVYYGPHYRDPWFRDDPWMDGNRWHRAQGPDTNVEIYIHPPRYRR